MPITDLIPWKREKNVPVRREVEHPVEALQRDMNRWFDSFFNRGSNLAPFEWFDNAFGSFYPRMNVTETEKELHVSAELPGLTEEDFDVKVSGDMLTISGEKREEGEHQGENYYRVERSYGSFQRSVPLTADVDVDAAEATFKNGVLSVVFPKTVEASASKQINIKSQ